MDCEIEDCSTTVAAILHMPWTDDQYVCLDHARAKANQDGVVADPLDNAREELPDGAGT